MGKYVYVVWYDNGEEWEDNFQDIEGIFSSEEKAVEYIESQDYELMENTFGKRREWARTEKEYYEEDNEESGVCFEETTYLSLRKFCIDSLEYDTYI